MSRKQQVALQVSREEREAVESRVSEKCFDTTSEYLRWLIGRDIGPGWPGASFPWLETDLADD